MDNKKQFTTQVIVAVLDDGDNEFKRNLICPFIPDTIMISNLFSSTSLGLVDDDMYKINTDLIQSMDNILCCFQPNRNTMSDNTKFQNDREVRGEYKFTTDIPIEHDGTNLTFTLTFSKN